MSPKILQLSPKVYYRKHFHFAKAHRQHYTYPQKTYFQPLTDLFCNLNHHSLHTVFLVSILMTEMEIKGILNLVLNEVH